MDLNYQLINGGTAYQVIPDVIGYNIENLIVPDTYNNLPVIGIGGDAFLSNGYLKTVILGNNIEFIGLSAFEACQYLNMVTIGKNLISINNSAFTSSPNLTRVYFNGNAPTFGSTLFQLTSPNLKLYRKKNFVTGWSDSVQGVPVVLWSDNIIKGGGTGKITGKSFIRKVIISGGTGWEFGDGNGIYIRNNENDNFVKIGGNSNLDYIYFYPYFNQAGGAWILIVHGNDSVASYDLINWFNAGGILGNLPTSQIFYKI